MLDTDIVSFGLRGEGQVNTRLLAQHPSEVCISSMTLAELRFGAEAVRSKKLHRLIDEFIRGVDVEPFDRSAADQFAKVGAGLKKQGQPIGILDTLIAAHAQALGVTLVTNNTKHFSRVAGLKLENWLGVHY